MNSTKCPQCGLVYWSTAPSCKRCGLANTPAESYATESPAHDQYAADQYAADQYAPDPYAEQNAILASHQTAMPMYSYGDPVADELLRVIRSNATFFYVIGGLQALLWLVVGNLLIVDGFFNIGLALLTHKLKSRVAAILLACLTGLSVLAAIVAVVTQGIGLFMLMPLVMIFRCIASWKLVSATFQWHAHEGEMEPVPPGPPVFDQGATAQW